MQNRVLIFLVLSLMFFNIFSCGRDDEKPADPASDENNESWVLAEVSNDDEKGLFRYLDMKPAGWNTIPLYEQISIIWRFDGVFPDNVTMEKMNTLEDVLINLESQTNVKLTLVMTLNEYREWCLYAKNYDAFMEKMNAALSDHEAYPIEIIHSNDPDWQYWQYFIDSLNSING